MNAHNEQQGARQFAAGYAAAKAELHAAAQEAVANITAVNGRGVEIEWISGTAKIGDKLYAAPVTAAPVDLHRHLLDMLGAKDHEDAGRIIGELHAAAPACPACEGRPSGENVPCAVCKSTPAAPGIDLTELRAIANDLSHSAKVDGYEPQQITFIESIRDRLLALIDASPKGATFHNDGNSEAQFTADEARLNCPSCGGSGHVEDSPKGGSEAQAVLDALVSLVAVARRYLPDYDEHPEIQKADDAIDAAMQAQAGDAETAFFKRDFYEEAKEGKVPWPDGTASTQS
ncbi:hypothetical protein STPYR_12750 [uncultured Stenotrophomonas sp.]|uniref:Uncharacterized protein n=1 Tax=uncultured Stenotrophomonas sp. TaxID=165438 RepID=A0A1Y5QBI1_9GAMM|nr:hypothetical protein STPYR_12750 [uncultured Stenotrophomonas sp.]